MRFIKYRNMIVKLNGGDSLLSKLNNKSVLGKGRIEIVDNWCGEIDYQIDIVESEDAHVEYGEKTITIYGKPETILSTTIIQSILFLLYQKRNLRSRTISLHASAVVIGNELVVFSGGKGSGKTSMAYLLAMKYKDVKLVANDYIELKINADGTYTVVYSDYCSEITFRSHVLYNLDKDLYVKLTNTDEYIFNQYVKGTADFIDLSRKTLKCDKLHICFVGLGKTKELEISHKKDAGLQLEIYKEVVQYLRGKSVVAIMDDRKTISDLFIDGSYFFSKEDSEYLFGLLNDICENDNSNIEWIRGQGSEIENYIMGCKC